MNKRVFILCCLLLVALPQLCLADPFGNTSLNSVVGTMLITGMAYLCSLVYIIMVALSKKAYPFFFALTLLLILLDVYEACHLLQTTNVYDRAFYLKHYTAFFMFSVVYYVFVIGLGVVVIRKRRI